MRGVWKAIVVAVLAAAGLVEATAQTPPAAAMSEPVMLPDQKIDYADRANWLCRPDIADGPCHVDLDAIAIDAQGRRMPDRYVAAKEPPLDCFYVYPTVSQDRSMFSDMVPDDRERAAVIAQAARFGQVCRVFAPVYRQFTLPALTWATSGHGLPESPRNYDDVRKAWRWYMATQNHGRGVVLIAHSQGSIVLTKLIKDEIDGKPAQKYLVSALLAGNLALTTARGSDRGGTFRSIPLCRKPGQVGCVVAWSTYPEGTTGGRVFGNDDAEGHAGACTNPAALAGGRGLLKGYIRKPAYAPPGDPPFIEMVDQIGAECVVDAAGAVLRVRAEPGPLASLVTAYLTVERAGPSWGVHSRDINLVEGNLVDIVEAQAKVWRAR